MRRLICAFMGILLVIGLLPGRAAAVDLELNAQSAVLMDVSTGTILFEKNAHDRLAPASVTKVMTMLLIMEAIDSGRLKMTDMVTASEAASAKGGSQIYLKVGENMSVQDMLKSIAVSSANDCACAMAEHLAGNESAFVTMMNERAAQLGMEDTHFVNCTGLDDAPNASEHRTCAYDIALMSRELLKNHPDIKKFTTIWMDTVRNGTFGLSNTNKLIRFYNGATGLKTGYTSGAGYCLSASAKREGMELIAVVMACESSQKRSVDCKTLLDYGFASYAIIRPALKEGRTVAVNLGKQETVPVELTQRQDILVEKAKRTNLTARVELERSINAPVEKGRKVGIMTVYSDGKVLIQLPLTAAESVPRLTFWDVFKMVWRKLLMAEVKPSAINPQPSGEENPT